MTATFDNRFGVEKLRGSTNYVTWATKIEALLLRDNSSIAINQKHLGPKNTNAQITITLLCADGPLLHIRGMPYAYDMWHKLKELYKPSGFITEYITLRQFVRIRLANYDRMEEYLNDIQRLLNDLHSQNIVLSKQLIIMWTLNNLGDEYKAYTTAIIQALRKDPNAYTVDSLFASLNDEARGKENEALGQTQEALNTIKNGRITKPYRAKAGLSLNRTKKAYKKLPFKGKWCEACKMTSHETSAC